MTPDRTPPPRTDGPATATATVRCVWCPWALTERGDLVAVARALGAGYAQHLAAHHPEHLPTRVES
jgi:hypothetical protein